MRACHYCGAGGQYPHVATACGPTEAQIRGSTSATTRRPRIPTQLRGGGERRDTREWGRCSAQTHTDRHTHRPPRPHNTKHTYNRTFLLGGMSSLPSFPASLPLGWGFSLSAGIPRGFVQTSPPAPPPKFEEARLVAWCNRSAAKCPARTFPLSSVSRKEMECFPWKFFFSSARLIRAM